MKPDRQSRVEQLVEAALELAERQRAEFLEQHCGQDTDLRREVESLLAFGSGAENFMEASALQIAAQVLAEKASESQLQDKHRRAVRWSPSNQDILEGSVEIRNRRRSVHLAKVTCTSEI